MFLYEVVDPIVKHFGIEWLSDLNIQTITVRLILAVICGGILGLERALKHHAAGLRTYIIVCILFAGCQFFLLPLKISLQKFCPLPQARRCALQGCYARLPFSRAVQGGSL